MDSSIQNGYMSLLDDSIRPDIDRLYSQITQLQKDYQKEQEKVIHLRKVLNEAEGRILQDATESNEKLGELTADLAHVRSCTEKSEALRHGLEFKLAQIQRQLTKDDQKKDMEDAEKEEINDNLKREIEMLREEMGDTLTQGKDRQKLFETQKQVLQAELNGKTQRVVQLEAERDIYRAEKSQQDATIQQQELSLLDLKDKIQELLATNKTQADSQRRMVSEVEYGKSKEERLKKDMKLATDRIKMLEVNIETERANHLETKFNAELIQLRVRDLEGAVGVEKCAQNEASKAVDRVTRQLRDLEQLHDDDRQKVVQSKDRIARLDKEKAELKDTLNTELGDKKRVMKSLSGQLDEHQINFTDLKAELAKANKQLRQLQENYAGTVTELELLVHNFDIADRNFIDKNSSAASAPKKKKVPTATLR